MHSELEGSHFLFICSVPCMKDTFKQHLYQVQVHTVRQYLFKLFFQHILKYVVI